MCLRLSRWPRTLAGITAYLQCTRNAHGSGIYPGNAQDERKAWRRCDRGGFWADDDYSRCQYANDVTRVLYMFNQVTGKSSDLLRLLITRGAHTKYISFLNTGKASGFGVYTFMDCVFGIRPVLLNQYSRPSLALLFLSRHGLALCLCLSNLASVSPNRIPTILQEHLGGPLFSSLYNPFVTRDALLCLSF